MTRYTDQLIVNEVYQAGDFEDDEISSSHFRNCEFVQVRFGTQIDVIFEGCKFEACDLTAANLSGSTFLNCTIEGCIFKRTRLDDCQFVECTIPNTDFIDCLLFGTTLRRTNLSSTSFMDCDAQFATIEECELYESSLEDTDLSDANLESAWGLTDEQVQLALGNARTILPEYIDFPEHWLTDELPVEDPSDEIPNQVAAPLRVIWRGERLVPDPRGNSDKTLRNPSVMTLLVAFRSDVDSLVLETPTNHPIMRHVLLLQQAASRGIISLNPTLVGYHIEVLKAQLKSSHSELSESTAGRINAIVAGGSILANQFTEWRNIAANSDEITRDRSALNEISGAINNLAASIRDQPSLIDRRIAETLEIQAQDIANTIPNEKIQKGAAKSTGNLLSALSSKLWQITRQTTKSISEKSIEISIKEFIKNNETYISILIKWAPNTLKWFRNILETFFT